MLEVMCTRLHDCRSNVPAENSRRGIPASRPVELKVSCNTRSRPDVGDPFCTLDRGVRVGRHKGYFPVLCGVGAGLVGGLWDINVTRRLTRRPIASTIGVFGVAISKAEKRWEETSKTARGGELLQRWQKLEAVLHVPMEPAEHGGGGSTKKLTRGQELEVRVATPVDGMGVASELELAREENVSVSEGMPAAG